MEVDSWDDRIISQVLILIARDLHVMSLLYFLLL